MRMACNRSSSGEVAPPCTKEAAGTRNDCFAGTGAGAAGGNPPQVARWSQGAGAGTGCAMKEADGTRKDWRCASGVARGWAGAAAGSLPCRHWPRNGVLLGRVWPPRHGTPAGWMQGRGPGAKDALLGSGCCCTTGWGCGCTVGTNCGCSIGRGCGIGNMWTTSCARYGVSITGIAAAGVDGAAVYEPTTQLTPGGADSKAPQGCAPTYSCGVGSWKEGPGSIRATPGAAGAEGVPGKCANEPLRSRPAQPR